MDVSKIPSMLSSAQCNIDQSKLANMENLMKVVDV